MVPGGVRRSYLSSCIDDLSRVILSFVPYLLAESVLDRGVVALDEVAIDIANREGRFACLWSELRRV